MFGISFSINLALHGGLKGSVNCRPDPDKCTSKYKSSCSFRYRHHLTIDIGLAGHDDVAHTGLIYQITSSIFGCGPKSSPKNPFVHSSIGKPNA